MSLDRIHPADLRVAMISMHTSPMDQPGSGDAGGMNVYIAQTARLMAEAGAQIDVFTRATSSKQPEAVSMAPGVTVHHLAAGPFDGLRKEDLPGQVCPFTAELMRLTMARPENHYDLVHSHYWLSGQAGWLAAQRWNIPLVHSMHTMAKVKNASLAATDEPEPLVRVVGEEQIVAASDHLLANTADERFDLIRHYDADPRSVSVVHPGVDLDVFHPRDQGAARRRAGLPTDKKIVLFVGRIQPLKAPDLLIRAIADLVRREPDRRDSLQLVICGGLSGNGMAHPDELERLAAEENVCDLVTFLPPVPPAQLADLYAAADVVAVPSYSESFGLVAVEAQASGTPVVAAAVGGLRTAVSHRVSGLLVDGHEPQQWSRTLGNVLADDDLRRGLATDARSHAEKFSWAATAAGTLGVYSDAVARTRADRLLQAVN